MGGVMAWLGAFFLLMAIVGILVYQVMSLIDLEFDYINPYELAARINNVVLPEFIIHGILCLLFLLSGHWIMVLFCIPMLYYNLKEYREKRHLIDVTEIFNLLSFAKRKCVIKLAYYVILLFLSIFWMIYMALEDD